MGFVVATKAFFKLLFDRDLSNQFEALVDGNLQPKIAEAKPQKSKPAPKPPTPARSDAIGLLSALQREARLVDIVNESLDQYSDEQIGSAARDVLRDTGKVFERMFGLEPLTELEDGAAMETPASFDPAEFRLTGNLAGEAPFKGKVAHHGWRATRCNVPQWSGQNSAAMIVAPVELEVN